MKLTYRNLQIWTLLYATWKEILTDIFNFVWLQEDVVSIAKAWSSIFILFCFIFHLLIFCDIKRSLKKRKWISYTYSLASDCKK